MARFLNFNNEDVIINIDLILSVYYDEESDKTLLYCSNDSFLEFHGNQVSKILNANNDVTMHDKHVANLIVDRFKMSLSSVVAKLDKIMKLIESHK